MTKQGGMPDSMRSLMGWVLGVGIIAFILLILVIIFGNLQGNVGFGQESNDIINQSFAFSDGGIIPTNAIGALNPTLSVTQIINITGNETITTDNYTVSGVIVSANETSQFNGTTVLIRYTIAKDGKGLIDTNSIILNYTTSATNTSAQFPTVGTIIGIAILLLILIALLVFVIVKMMGVSSGTASSGLSGSGGSNSFGGSDRGFS